MCKKGEDVAGTLFQLIAKLPWKISPAHLHRVKMKMGQN